MNKTLLLKQRLHAIAQRLEADPDALGLLGLGSAGKELERMDAYSDLDFFAIVKTGCKQEFIDDLAWLSDVHPIEWCFRNTVDGYKLLFADRVFCEFAVFEPPELAHIPYAEGQYIYRAEELDGNSAKPQVPVPKPSTDEHYLLGELLTNLYVGLCRYRRGEKVSAMRFVQIYALDRLINLLDLAATDPQQYYRDDFCPDRRVEHRHQTHQTVLMQCTLGAEATPESANTMLDYVVQHYNVNAVLVDEIRQLL